MVQGHVFVGEKTQFINLCGLPWESQKKHSLLFPVNRNALSNCPWSICNFLPLWLSNERNLISQILTRPPALCLATGKSVSLENRNRLGQREFAFWKPKPWFRQTGHHSGKLPWKHLPIRHVPAQGPHLPARCARIRHEQGPQPSPLPLNF